MNAIEPAVRISPVAGTDLQSLAQLARDIWYLHYPGMITVSQIDYMLAQRYQPEVIALQIESGEAWWDKLEVQSQLAGFASYEPGSESSSIKLDKLYVNQRFMRRGLGSALLNRVEEQSRSRGYRSLYLQVNKGNAPSIAFYRSNGFEVKDSVKVDIGNQFFMDDFVFSKSLTESDA
jgi:ribosomal protein S18 acetylase RimI-like enzyme